MSEVMMKVLEQQVASLGRQVKELAAKNADLVVENERVRNLLTEFDKRHDLDAEALRATEAALVKARAARLAADFKLVDRYRNPKSGIFSFPEDVAAIILALDEARAQLAGQLQP